MSDPTSNTAASPVILSANKVKELTQLMREASAILNEIPEASAPKNMRFPLVDELDGFSHMLAQAANIEPLQGPEIVGIRAYEASLRIDSEKLQQVLNALREGLYVTKDSAKFVEAIGIIMQAMSQAPQQPLSQGMTSAAVKESPTAEMAMAEANAVLQDLWVYKDLAWVHKDKLHICQGPEHADRMRSIGAEVFDMRDAHKMNLSDSVIDQVCRQVFDGESDPAQRENWIASFKLVATAHAKQAAEQAIAFLRRNSDEPFSIELCDGIDVEVRPITEDQRVTVGCEGQGYTIVNYTGEGLILDVYSADKSSLEPCATMALDRSDLDDPNLDDVNQGDQSRPTGG